MRVDKTAWLYCIFLMFAGIMGEEGRGEVILSCHLITSLAPTHIPHHLKKQTQFYDAHADQVEITILYRPCLFPIGHFISKWEDSKLKEKTLCWCSNTVSKQVYLQYSHPIHPI